MELFGIATIPYPQDFYKILQIVMAQWEKLLEYCDGNLLLVFKTKPVKERKPANEEVVDANENELKSHLCVMFLLYEKEGM